MAEPFIGEIRMVGFNFAPVGWELCAGQTLAISQYTALFSLLGTNYGGNGQTTFNLPDLRGRVAINQGQGPGLSNYALGQSGGAEFVSLLTSQLPSHNHTVSVSNQPGLQSDPTSNILAVVNEPTTRPPSPYPAYSAASAATGTMAPAAIGNTGGGQGHNNIQPFLTVNFIIATQGIFPSRQ